MTCLQQQLDAIIGPHLWPGTGLIIHILYPVRNENQPLWMQHVLSVSAVMQMTMRKMISTDRLALWWYLRTGHPKVHHACFNTGVSWTM